MEKLAQTSLISFADLYFSSEIITFLHTAVVSAITVGSDFFPYKNRRFQKKFYILNIRNKMFLKKGHFL